MPKEKPSTWKKCCYASDESGKGDFYGGPVVAGVYLNRAALKELKKLPFFEKIKDSKKVKKKIRSWAPQIISALGKNIVVKSLSASKYNELYSKHGNMNTILAILHNEVHLKLKNKFKVKRIRVVDAYVDKFWHYRHLKNEGIEYLEIDDMCERAEDKYLCCALASIVARYFYLIQMDEMSEKFQTKFPLHRSWTGEDSIIPAFKKLSGIVRIEEFCKANFKVVKYLDKVVEKDRFWENCKECGFYLEHKSAKNIRSKFIGCSNFPNCCYAIPEKEKILNEKCESCGAFLFLRYRTKDGVAFFGCSSFPNGCKKSRDFWFPVCINNEKMANIQLDRCCSLI